MLRSNREGIADHGQRSVIFAAKRGSHREIRRPAERRDRSSSFRRPLRAGRTDFAGARRSRDDGADAAPRQARAASLRPADLASAQLREQAHVAQEARRGRLPAAGRARSCARRRCPRRPAPRRRSTCWNSSGSSLRVSIICAGVSTTKSSCRRIGGAVVEGCRRSGRRDCRPTPTRRARCPAHATCTAPSARSKRQAAGIEQRIERPDDRRLAGRRRRVRTGL